jgi:hypothetical protein
MLENIFFIIIILNNYSKTLLLQLPICKSRSRLVVLHGLFTKLPASPVREQIKACAQPRGGLFNKLAFLDNLCGEHFCLF